MKKILLFSAALMAASSAFAVVPSLQKVDFSAFSAPKSFTIVSSDVQIKTRAEGDMESMDFTYAGAPNQVFSLKDATAGVTRIYLAFEMTVDDVKTFKGSKVTGFNVFSPIGPNNGANSITDARFFYMLTLGKEEYSQDFSISSTPGAENRIAMEEPYTITGKEDGIVFGYSFIVPEKNDMAYLITDYQPTVGTAGLYASSNTDAFPSKFSSFAGEIGALCMSVTLEMETLPKFISFTSFPETICLKKGGTLALPITLSATSGVPIESISLEYSLGGKLNEQTYTGSPLLPEGIGRLLNVNVDFPAENEKLKETVEFKLTKINGVDNVCDGNAVSATVVVLDEVPVHQTLYEEYTGTWCQYCPRGFAALEYISKNHPDFVTASYHYGQGFSAPDPMQVLSFYPSDVPNFPTSVLNRTALVDPYDGTGNYSGLVPVVGDIEALNAIPSAWKIDVSHSWESDNSLVATVEVAHMAGFDNKNYKIAYLLVADGLSGSTTTWLQVNYYASQPPSSDMAPEFNAFCRGGKYGQSKVKGLEFNDVVISSTGVMGIAGSIPESLEAEQIVSHSLTFDLSKVKKALLPDKNKLRVIAMVLDKNGQVLNCAKNEVNDYDEFVAAVEGISDENAPVEYYNLNGMKISEPTQGIVIRRQGSKAEKIIIR